MAKTNKTTRINKEGQKVDQEKKVDNVDIKKVDQEKKVDNVDIKKVVKLSPAAESLQTIVREELAKSKQRFVDLAKAQGYSEDDSEKISTKILGQFTANKWSSLAWSRSTRSVRSKSQAIKDLLAGKNVEGAPQEVLDAVEKLKAYL